MSEIRHINALYRLWDALLERFPHLLIDHCASSGRRLDIETLRRSIPLWRSDYQCSANYQVEGAQCHHLTFNRWMPYSGTGSGRPYDTYRMRSAYSPALATNYTFSEREFFGDDPQKLAWLREQSPFAEAVFNLHGIVENACYAFTDADTGERTSISGAELKAEGFHVRLSQKRSSGIYFYQYQ